MEKSLKVPDKARQMIDYLLENIHSSKFKQGSRLPPLRELKEQFGISIGTAKRGIDYLCYKGILESHRGSGTFVTKKNQCQTDNSTDKIIVLIPWVPDKSSIMHTIYSGIVEESLSQKTQVILSYVSLENFKHTDLENLTSGCSALVLLGEYDMIFQQSLNMKIPVVVSGMHNNLNGSTSFFEMDPFQSAELAVEYFKKYKIKHVKCYAGNHPVGVMRLQQFKLHWENAGGTVHYQQLTSADEAEKISFEPSGAFLFSSGSLMNIFCRRSIVEFDLQLAESATILGLDGRSCFEPDLYQAPSIYADWKQMGHDIYLECMRRINNPGVIPRRYYYPVNLISPNRH